MDLQELIDFSSGVLAEYERSGNLSSSLCLVSKQGYKFAPAMQRGIDAFGSGISAESALDEVSKIGPDFEELKMILSLGLETGADIRKPLKNFIGKLRIERKYLLRGASTISNFLSISKLGSFVFFPIFAGISIEIMSFSGLANGSSINPVPLFCIFGAYIVIANYANARFSIKNQSNRQLLIRSLLYSLVGLAIFKISTVFALSAIGE